MDETGKIDSKLMPKFSDDFIKQMYEKMVLARKFDEKALKLQRQGRIGTYASTLGQEACQVGSALALNQEDWVFPAFRENAVFIARGVPMEYIFGYWGGDERGNKLPEGLNEFTVSIPVGSQPLYAAGFAMASNIKKEKVVSIVYFGDGATSEGDVHEAMNFAGVYKAPIIFLCQNNQYAISTPRFKQNTAQTLAQKALGYGFEGIQVDGNDIFAVYKVVQAAAEKARKGDGPTFLELYTYRMENHTTADDATRYRSDAEVKKWGEKDPIARLQKYMTRKKLWSKDYEEKLQADCKDKVNEAVQKYESVAKPSVEDIFKYTFYELPQELKEQQEYLKKFIGDGTNE